VRRRVNVQVSKSLSK